MTLRAASLIPLFATALAAGRPRPPAQPASGYGGSRYAHAGVTRRVYEAGVEQYWVFEPARPSPQSAPLVVFNHGWMGMVPAVYLGWIHHIVRRGNIVVFPRYQDGLFTAPWTFTPNSVQAVQRALKRLKEPGHVRPELDRFAIVGHSAGAVVSANMAALAAEKGLPKPKALMIVQPGRGTVRGRTFFFPSPDYKKIPADVAMLVLVGADDRIVSDYAAKDLFRATPQIPRERKDYVVVRSDRRGSPALVADHISPCAPFRAGPLIRGRCINAINHYAYWRLFDALVDFAFHGRGKAHCLGNTPQQRAMGRWSDGTPVKELLVTGQP